MNEIRKLMEAIEQINEDEINPDLVLPRGKKMILQVEEGDYKRGLIIEAKEGGGYDVEYWYENPSNITPAEVKVDGKKIKDDAMKVYLGFHPEKGDTEEEELPEANGILPDRENDQEDFATQGGSNDQPYGPDWDYFTGGRP